MDSRQLFVAFGPQVYRVVRPWGETPPTIKLGIISKCAVDRAGNLYICQRADPPVIVYDDKGRFARAFGDGAIVDAHGIFVTADDRVLVVDRDGHQVMCFDSRGHLLFALGERTRPRFQAPFSHPTDVAVGPSGDIYVTDGYGNTMVHRFSADGQFRNSWGGFGSGPGQFTTPHGIKVLTDGRVLVGDRENNRLQVFDPAGRYLTEWRGFYHPMDIHVHEEMVYVTDQVPRVVALRSDGTMVGACKPVLTLGHGMSGDRAGHLYFVETRTTIITRLEPVT